MPITCTNKPSVLRVMYTAFADQISRREVVCYLEPTEDGMVDLLYSHHTDYNRPNSEGPWEPPHDFVLDLTPALRAEISTNVMYEFWSTFGFRVRPLAPKGGIHAPVARFEGGVDFVR